MSAVDNLISVCASQIGYYRKPGTRTKFGEWYGLPTGQWCAMYLSWAADQAGLQSVTPKHAYTPSGVNWFKARGQWYSGTRGIRRGDWVYFDFPGAPNRVSHVAIVESVNSDGSVNTIEGNTSGPTGDQRNGGACLRKRRKAYIVGYGRPNYAGSTPQAPARNYIQLGDTGEGVVLLQKRLIAAGFGVGPFGADGDFGPSTKAAVLAFQTANNLEPDGVVGPATNAKLTPAAQVFHGTKGVHTGRLTPDGNFELIQDGEIGGGTYARWHQIMGLAPQGVRSRDLIQADQRFLNSVLSPGDIANLDPNQRRRRNRLEEDGLDDFNNTHTSRCRQYWLRNVMGVQHQINLIGKRLDYDGYFGNDSVRVLQFALNQATAGSRRYGQVA